MWEELAAKDDWHAVKSLAVSHKPGAEIKRIIGLFSRDANQSELREHLNIYTGETTYSNDFIQLLGPYYLNL